MVLIRKQESLSDRNGDPECTEINMPGVIEIRPGVFRGRLVLKPPAQQQPIEALAPDAQTADARFHAKQQLPSEAPVNTAKQSAEEPKHVDETEEIKPSKPLLCVEFPGILQDIRNPHRAIASLGGMDAIHRLKSRILEAKDSPPPAYLTLNLDYCRIAAKGFPDDHLPMTPVPRLGCDSRHAIQSAHAIANFKPFQLVFGLVSCEHKLHRVSLIGHVWYKIPFQNNLADFQYGGTRLKSDVSKKRRIQSDEDTIRVSERYDDVVKFSLEMIRQRDINKAVGHEAIMSEAPDEDFCSEWMSKMIPMAFVGMNRHERKEERQISIVPRYRVYSDYILAFVPDIPSVPDMSKQASLFMQDGVRSSPLFKDSALLTDTLKKKLSALFRDRPIWNPVILLDQFPEQLARQRVVPCVKYYGYTFMEPSPWANMYIRHGSDPRNAKGPDFAKYQPISIRIDANADPILQAVLVSKTFVCMPYTLCQDTRRLVGEYPQSKESKQFILQRERESIRLARLPVRTEFVVQACDLVLSLQAQILQLVSGRLESGSAQTFSSKELDNAREIIHSHLVSLAHEEFGETAVQKLVEMWRSCSGLDSEANWWFPIQDNHSDALAKLIPSSPVESRPIVTESFVRMLDYDYLWSGDHLAEVVIPTRQVPKQEQGETMKTTVTAKQQPAASTKAGVESGTNNALDAQQVLSNFESDVEEIKLLDESDDENPFE